MKETDYLLFCLSEECIEASKELLEVGKLACKTFRFGADDRNVEGPPDGPTNRERLVAELNDVLGTIGALAEAGLIPKDWIDSAAQERKKQKLLKFMDYSRKHGIAVEKGRFCRRDQAGVSFPQTTVTSPGPDLSRV